MAQPSKYKRKKKSKEKVDRMSHLPDAVLGHILSFVCTKQSVQTSVLSKRWLHVWTNVPCIDIDDSTLLATPILGTDQIVNTSFINFINNVFNPCNEASIRKFTLKFSDKFDRFNINRWILAATKHRVRELDICITRKKRFKMSNSLFAYEELVELKLGTEFILNVPGTFCFPTLKKLHLHCIEFRYDDINKFLSSCPVLEDLHLEKCWAVNLYTLDINAPALKFLTLDNNSLVYCKFILEAQNLKVLNYSGTLSTEGCCFKNFSSLIKADINVDLYTIYNFQKRKYIPHALDMARAIANAKILCLRNATLELFSFPDRVDLPIFHNLTELQLTGSEHCGLLLSQLLHNSPNLEVLVIDEGILARCKMGLTEFMWKSPFSVPECFYLHLKVVKIWGFNEEKGAGELIRFVLLHARVLNEFLVARSKSELKEVIVSEQILKSLRRSKTRDAKFLLRAICSKSEPKELKISYQLLEYFRRPKTEK